MPRYAPKMSQTDLRQLLINLAIKHNYIEEYGPIDIQNPDMNRIIWMLLMEELIPTVEKDWSKINFSTENISIDAQKMTQDGIPYLEFRMGGDWESPLWGILYFDGKTFRGFVPKNGNPYNYKEKSAFGNNDNDYQIAVSHFGYTGSADDLPLDIKPNKTLMEAEINTRLEARGAHSLSGAPVVSRAVQQAKKQAEIEKGQTLTGDITADMVWAVINLAAGASYVTFKLRSSGRALTADEGNRVVGVPSILEKNHRVGEGRQVLWYSPSECYPLQTQKILEQAGFEKAPDNDISIYAHAKTVYIKM